MIHALNSNLWGRKAYFGQIGFGWLCIKGKPSFQATLANAMPEILEVINKTARGPGITISL